MKNSVFPIIIIAMSLTILGNVVRILFKKSVETQGHGLLPVFLLETSRALELPQVQFPDHAQVS